MRLFSISLGICLMLVLSFSCSTKKKEQETVQQQQESKLGEIHFEVTGAAAAQPHFEKGLLLLHSFEYEDARESFLKAQEIDSTFAMAYWGEAMTYNHSLWQRQEKEKALAALNKLAPDAASRASLNKI